jgi:hypothetical protein
VQPPEAGQSQQSRLGKLHNVPELPPHFLPRPQQVQGLKEAVLAGTNSPVGITGTAWVGVQGMGGIGKSVLAAALVRQDPEVQQAFPNGVFWVTVGQDPNLGKQGNQANRMVGCPCAHAPELEQARIHP